MHNALQYQRCRNALEDLNKLIFFKDNQLKIKLTGGFGGLGGAQVSEAALLDLPAMGDKQIAGGAQWLRSAAALLAKVAALVARAQAV